LRRIEVTFVDTVIRVEHTPRSGEAPGVALEIHIKRLEYCDEVVRDPGQALTVDIHQLPAFVQKILQLSNVLLYYEEFGEGKARHSPLIQIGSCSGYTEMRIKLKQNEAFPGAKLELDGKIGSLHLLLAPQQIVHLADLLSSLNLSESGILQEQLSKNRPLDSEDLKLIEQDLSQQLHSGLASAPAHLEGMAAGVENGEMFFSMAPMTSSVTSLRSVSDLSDLDSSVHSDISTTPLQPPTFVPGEQLSKNRPLDSEDLKLIEQDLSQQLHSGLASAPAHLEGMAAGVENGEMFFSMAPMTSSVTSLRSVSDLSDLDSSVHSDISTTPLQPPTFVPGLILGSPRRYRRLPFASTLPGLNKIPGKAGPLPPPSLDSQRPEMLLRVTVGGLTVTLLHQPPGLFPSDVLSLGLAQHFFSQLGGLKDTAFGGRDFHPLRHCFEEAIPRSHVSLGPVPYSQAPQPCARIRSKHLEKLPSSKRGLARGASSKLTVELTVELANFLCEVDLGTLDRLCSLLQPAMVPPRPGGYPPEEPVPGFPPAAQWQANVQLVAPKGSLLLQFPVPDLRVWAERRAWAEKAVRRERLRLDLAGVELHTDLEPTGPVQLEVTLTDLHGIYEDGGTLSVPCFRVGKAPDLLARGIGKKYLLPKLILTFCPTPTDAPWDLALAATEEVELSTVESPCELKQPEPSPFSSKRTMYETEEMVIPGDPEEMAEFQSQTLAASHYTLELTFPTVHIYLPSKKFYESIYNRINNDLLMWEPFSPPPSPTDPPGGAGSASPFASDGLPPTHWPENFQMCKSAFKLDSDSEDDDSHFYSADQTGVQQKRGEQRNPFPLSCISVVLRVGQGRITALCNAKGEGGKKLEAAHGELVLDVENGSLFSVSHYKGREDIGYFCIEAEKVALYHKAVVEDYLTAEHLEIPNFLPPDGLHPTIYASQEGSINWPLGAKKDVVKMLSVAIKINLDLEKNIKEFLVTLRLEGATIRHRMALAHQSWYTQLIDFLDVPDDPILGFVPPAIITILHTHLFNCAMDYRPLYLPLRVLITAETFTLSSNIIVDTSVFLLRFILDNSTLFLSNKCEAETGDLNKDYVCVVEMDLLELVITTWKGDITGKLTRPLFELRCSNNVVHIHTCADSCAALANLIQYVVNNGDLHPPPRHDSPTEIAGQKVQLPESPASLPTCPPAETAAINQRDLTDALMDTERGYPEMTGETGGEQGRPSPVSVYLFPGEKGAAGQGKTPPPPVIPVGKGLDFTPSEDSEGESEATDGFCILDAPGTGIPPRDGEPVVTKLLDGPVHIQEGHFSRPLGSTDLLKAPSHFPMPESRVVMREISVVWHLYGGRDFGPGRSASGHMTKSSLPSTRSSPSRSSVPGRPQSSWRAQGGPGRIHDLLMEIQLTKVSFQHESYSGDSSEKLSVESEEQPLARQVFIVQELEIRDRLASSQINKFLYLYSSELLPRRAHSNMLTIKALHVCPEAGGGGPECCLRVSLMPLRLNIDQDALFFLKDFFTSVVASINPVVPIEAGSEGPVESPGKDSAERMMATSVETTTSENSSSASSSSEQPIYFREFRFTSEVPIWLDYHGKHVTVDQVGTFAGILIGLAQLNCSELKLKRLCCRHGLLGVEKVVNYALTEWLTDIRKNQLPGILGGVGPMHSFVQLFHGLRDLFWLPIEQYRKDGRIIRGLQRGAASFGTSTASAALELSNRLVQAIQATAETVYDILSPTAPPSRALPDRKYARKLRRSHQPADLREGVAKAYDTVREGVIDTAQAICDVAARGHEQKGITGAVGGVLRQIPPTVVKPLIVASEATSNLLGGMRNQIKPDALKEESLKWRLEDSQD
ncbi:autophagy-related protein 2 homolog A, partial [Protobothrops mucrosquamatus]|uniref:autophagy-related protein 2 homolog A n=1 Tax=Protobothrops mucrosquamatus TaxID=103944 RepID=UPI0010FB233B